MTNITIPPEAVEAAASAYTAVIYRGNGTTREFHDAITAALRAGIAAWPGVRMMVDIDTGDDSALKLPLPQEEKFQPYTCTRCLGATENADDICDDCAKEASDD